MCFLQTIQTLPASPPMGPMGPIGPIGSEIPGQPQVADSDSEPDSGPKESDSDSGPKESDSEPPPSGATPQDPNTTNQMILAISLDSPTWFRILIDNGGDPCAKNSQGVPLLHILIATWQLRSMSRTGFVEILSTLIDKGADLNVRDQRGNTAIHLCMILDTPPEAITILISGGAQPTIRGASGGFPIHAASFVGNLERILALVSSCKILGVVDYGLNEQDQDGHTALILASEQGHTDVVRALIDLGADTEIRSNMGFGALQYSCCFGRRDVSLQLLLSGADPNPCVGGDSPNPIHFCAEDGDHQMIRQLISRGANIDCTDDLGRTPLIVAISNRRTSVVLQLLLAGASTTICDNWGRRAIDFSVPGELRELIRRRSVSGE